MSDLPVTDYAVAGQELAELLEREWLVTNGIGGYAAGTLSGTNTRRYHGLLVAATEPPAGRRVRLANLIEEVVVDGARHDLSTNEFADGTLHPRGWGALTRFRLIGNRPEFTYRVGDTEIVKTVWMDHGSNRTRVRYALRGGAAELRIRPLVTDRDFHSETRADVLGSFLAEHDGRRIVVRRDDEAVLGMGADCDFEYAPESDWFWGVAHRKERARGFDCLEDLWCPGVLSIRLENGDTFALAADAGEGGAAEGAESLRAFDERQKTLVAPLADPVEKRLALAADQFLVARGGREVGTVIAGYHWFGDWGRDTMIALPGLALPTGRAAQMREILLEYGEYVDRGMIPNRFPDFGTEPSYNTVDATLWWFEAVARYLEATADHTLLDDLLMKMVSVVEEHDRGTRYGIGVDPEDGLLRAGEPGVQLTWMDAKVGDWVVTPRIGKAVEINALWYSALRSLQEWLERVGLNSRRTREKADRVAVSFRARFWDSGLGHLYDVVDGPRGDDAALRPNQLLALSLAHPLLHGEIARSIVSRVREELLTEFGMRTLSPRHPDYAARYEGGPLERDGGYHQGTVWPWPIGAYVDAHLHAFGSADGLEGVLDGLLGSLDTAGLGSISEVYDGDPPHRPDGCVAQGWSVAEVLRAYGRLRDARAAT
jgi:predicted glycogen debranching enzyme